MGLLDDAIREHLELKRRHGADPSEVARQEREALGPPAPPAEPQSREAGAASATAEPATPAPPAEPATAAEAAPPEPPETAVSREDLAPPPAPAEAAGSRPLRKVTDEDLDEDLDWSEPAPLDEEPADGPDAEAPAEGGEEDVLEETPDFLQETPEHDRLWFEQRPPRDFDF
jgi:hypothetical protein